MDVSLEEVLAKLPEYETRKDCFLSVYSVTQCYGGPEEGGWWYSFYDLEVTKHFYSWEAAEKAYDSLTEWAEEQTKERKRAATLALANMPEGNDPYLDTEGYIPRHQVGDEEIYLVVEKERGENQTTERPHYE